MGRLRNVLSSITKRLRQTKRSLTTSTISLATLIDKPPKMFNCCLACFHGDQPKDIVMVTNHEPEIETQLPSDLKSFELLFEDFVEDLDLTGGNKLLMSQLPIEKKWRIYCSYDNERGRVDFDAEYFVERLGHFLHPELSNSTLFTSLHTSLRTQPTQFILKFLSLNGLPLLLSLLPSSSPYSSSPSINSTSSQIVKCIRALMNNSKGRANFLQEENNLRRIASLIGQDCVRTKIDVYEILGAVCLVPKGHRLVLSVVGWLEEELEERARFLTILNDLDRSTSTYKDSISLKTAILSFLNALINYGPDNIEFRLHLRFELVALGMDKIICKLKRFENETLDKHLQFFETVRLEDEKEFYSNQEIDTTSLDSVFSVLKSKLSHNCGASELLGILNHLLLLQDPQTNHSHISLLHKITQEIVLKDSKILPINVDEIIGKIERNKIEEEKWRRMEEELKRREEEGRRMRIDVERERKERGEEIQRILREKEEMETKFLDKHHDKAFNEITQQDKMIDKITQQDKPQNKIITQEIHQKIIPPPPPLPPLSHTCPPPPPLPQAPLATNLPLATTPQTNHTTTTKSLNWNKLHETKGTLWETLETTQKPNLNLLTKLFTSNTLKPISITPKTKSIMDPRRAQNLQILLSSFESKLKLNPQQIIVAIETKDECISADFLEQLLKFLPNFEELKIISELELENDLSKADAFLWRLSKIADYKGKCQSLYFKKKFSSVHLDVMEKLGWLRDGSVELRSSGKLGAFLGIVLCVGNHMNTGPRGNATGFKISSLLKLKDTKGTNGVTLLTFLAEQIFLNYKNLVDMEGSELTNVRSAAGVCLAEIEREVVWMRKNLVDEPSFEPAVKGVEEQLCKTVQEVQKTCAHFGEDKGEELFAIFGEFLGSWGEVMEGLVRASEKTLQRNRRASIVTQNQKELAPKERRKEEAEEPEFDDLICALRTGDVFTDQVLKKRGNRGKRAKKEEIVGRERI